MAKDDIFLKIDGGRQGPIKGSSIDSAHGGEIDVLSWNWGMQGNNDAHEGQKGRSTVHELEFTKRSDNASTGLMSALRNNEPITTALLTVREAGGTNPLEYMKITMQKGRITQFRAESSESDSGPATVERVRIAFQKIRVEYQGQAKSGGSKGTSTFETEVTPGT